MARVAFSTTHDGGRYHGGWFETDSAEVFEGKTPEFDSRSMTEYLYLTADGDWFLNEASGEDTTYTRLDADDAHTWLKDNNHPEAAKRYFERPKGGRPKIGERLITTAPARMHNEIAELAEMYAEDMPETIRRLLCEALEHRRIIGAPGSRQEG
ncbi:hypothetical protein OG497_37975 [Streptomyces sp. NBC_01242]|uniref:hypothetical protein n=1 Tax=Streptomyces sp. NBC_01242 TaxID=2903795 RepID=UPI0022554FC3|nr:hypothetical protein [Streptomyces sp. NBC_01242]MCX4799648.1 hypothetical protein [Streptomyces sp. NBC_01242]